MTTYKERSPLDDEQFDRLVDDALSEPERRELLGRLDSEPSGWRRCALAFLESQCWKRALGGMAVAQGEPTTPARPERAAPVSRRSPWPGRLGTLLAMAASFLLVFWIGSFVQRERAGAPVNNPGAPFAKFERHSAPSRLPEWRTVVVSDRSGRPPISTVRAIERNDADDQWWARLPSAMPDDVRQAFQRSGHQIDQQRQLVPVSLDDGRRLVVPVDQVDVHYIGNGSY